MDMAKEEAKKLIDKLPDQANWDDIMYEFYVRKKLEVALMAAEDGRVVSHEEVKKGFLHHDNRMVESAVADLAGIREYIGGDSEYYAARFIGRIIETVERLEIHRYLSI